MAEVCDRDQPSACQRWAFEQMVQPLLWVCVTQLKKAPMKALFVGEAW
jgi:hypothetical protein